MSDMLRGSGLECSTAPIIITESVSAGVSQYMPHVELRKPLEDSGAAESLAT